MDQDNPNFIKLQLTTEMNKSSSDGGLSCLKCWVNYFSNFYIFWELLYLVSMVLGLQVFLIKYSYQYLPIHFSLFYAFQLYITTFVFLTDMFYCFVVQHSSSLAKGAKGLTTTIKESAVCYLHSYFVIDLLSNVPVVFDLLIHHEKEKYAKLLFANLFKYETP